MDSTGGEGGEETSRGTAGGGCSAVGGINGGSCGGSCGRGGGGGGGGVSDGSGGTSAFELAEYQSHAVRSSPDYPGEANAEHASRPPPKKCYVEILTLHPVVFNFTSSSSTGFANMQRLGANAPLSQVTS